MPITRNRIEGNLSRIRADVEAACARTGRNPRDVRIVAVTKADLPSAETVRDRLAQELQTVSPADSQAASPASHGRGGMSPPPGQPATHPPSDVLLISAVTGQGLNKLVGAIAQQLRGDTDGW